jgi:transcriptional regulator with XRE-family HTH domain
MNEKLLSRRQIAELFNISVSTVRRWELEKDFPEPAFKRKHTIRYARVEVLAFMKRNAEQLEGDDGRP